MKQTTAAQATANQATTISKTKSLCLSFGLNIGLFKQIRQTIIQIKREHQQAYSL